MKAIALVILSTATVCWGCGSPEPAALDAKIERAAKRCQSPAGPDDCERGFRELADILGGLSAAPDTPGPFARQIEQFAILCRQRPAIDPEVRAALEDAYRMVNDGEPFETPRVEEGRAPADLFNEGVEAARSNLREGRVVEGMKGLVAAMLLIITPVEQPM